MAHLRTVLALSLLLFPLGCGPSAPPKVLQVGDKAPSFSLMDASGHWFKSSDVQPGYYLALFFYRGSWCGACENWLLDLRRDVPQFTAAHVAVAAVSVDPVDDSAIFNNQWRFPFPLLSDGEFHLIDAYGFRDPKGGHHGEDISRVGVVVVDPQGVVRYVRSAKEAYNHPKDDEVLFEIKQMQAGVPKGGAS